MGSDLFALCALAKELNEQLQGARIDKIQQPETDELRFFVRSKGKNRCLVVSCNAGAPRIHFTTSKKASPMVAPNLCMLLRKYLTNASIESVKIYNADRILQLKFNAKTEMRDDKDFYLFVEIMNRYSNIVFTDENLVILDAVKHLPLDMARDHVVLRGVTYAPVAQKKISYLNDCFSVFDNFAGGDLHKFILDNISGFAGTTVSEILLRSALSDCASALSKTQKDRLFATIRAFASIGGDNPQIEIEPCVIQDKEVYPIVYKCLDDGANVKRFESMSEAFDALVTDADKDIRNKARLKSLATQAKHLRQKVEKNVAIDLSRLKECEDMDKFRIYGELIVNNIYRIQKGDENLVCTNYYDDTEVKIPLDARLSPSKNSTAYYNKYNKLKRTKEFTNYYDDTEVKIPLDARLSPSKNSTAYYNKYNKLKRTKEFTVKKLADDKDLLEYVKSIEDEIANLPYESDLSSIEDEIVALGGGKKQKSVKKIRKEKAEPPYIYEVDGFYIYRGKNNVQNDELTFKTASSSDIWMHLKNDHGAHTIIVTDGREVPDNVIKIASEITASTKTANVEVDYTARRNVKRKPNGHPGQVIYVNYQTVVATPNKHEEYLKKATV